MGLLNMDMQNPESQGFNSALMQAAAMLLTPRGRGGGIGSAFAAMPQAIERAQQQAQRGRLLGMQEQQIGLQTAEAQRKAQAQAQQQQYLQRMIAGLPPEQRAAAMVAPEKFAETQLPGKPQLVEFYDDKGRAQKGWAQPGQAPQPVGGAKREQAPELARLLEARDSLPEGHPWRAVYDAQIAKSTTHAPAASTNVFTGTLTPAEVNGKPVFAMGGKDGTAQVVPGLQPAGTAETAAKQDARRQATIKSASIIINKVDDALSKVSPLTTGAVGSVIGNVPGTQAYDLRRAAETIKANLGFDQLKEMREMSPTGGALGQVAVQELAMLQAAVSNLDPNQSPAELKKNLNEVSARYKNVIGILEGSEPTAPSASRMRFNAATGKLEPVK